MTRCDQPFEAGDVGLLEKVLALVPDLRLVAYTAKVARERLSYPIADHEALRPLFEGTDTFGDWKGVMNMGMTKKHLPVAFFPITSEDDLITKVHLGLAIGQTSHAVGRGHVPSASTLEALGVPLTAIRKTQPHLFTAENG
jgi:hypothetical protein